MHGSLSFWLTTLLFGLTYLALALGKVPGLRVDRAGIALIGATVLMVTGILSLADAVRSVNYETVVLLFGMMVLVGCLRLGHFFERLARWTLVRVRSPLGLLAVGIGLAGGLSAFLVNDVVCLALAPLVLNLTRRLGLNPMPYLLGLATGANIGSTATITGNPQNMIIGTLSHLSYAQFAARLLPVALIALVIDFALVAWVYRHHLVDGPAGKMGGSRLLAPALVPHLHRAHSYLLRKSLIVTLAVVALFFTGLPIALVALGGAAVLLLLPIRPEKIYRQVDWSLLVLFTGLFVIVHAFETNVVSSWDIENWTGLLRHPVTVLSLVSAVLSNLVSNVPAVLLFKPIIPAMPVDAQPTAWLALAMSSTFAGNLTILGSVANLIVVESARREGYTISLLDYCRIGIPLTVLTLAAGVAWLKYVPY